MRYDVATPCGRHLFGRDADAQVLVLVIGTLAGRRTTATRDFRCNLAGHEKCERRE